LLHGWHENERSGANSRRLLTSAPDLIRAWRRPSVVIPYTRTAFDAADPEGVDAAGMSDGNVIVRVLTDQSVFPPAS